MKTLIKLAIGVLSISALAGCGEAPEVPLPEDEEESEVIPEPEPTHTHSFIHDYGYPATFFEDGVKEHQHCDGCNKDFDMEGNEITDTKLPK